MIIFSVCNIFVYFFQIISLMNQCQEFSGPFCSAIRISKFAQYWKLVFGEFFLYFFISMSNFMYISFAISRLSLIGNDHSKLVKFFSDTSVLKLTLFFVFLSTGLSVIKPLMYKINENTYHPDQPILFYKENNFQGLNKTIIILKLTLNSVYEILNYCLFVLVSLVIDVNMLIKVRRVILEKKRLKWPIRLNRQERSCEKRIKVRLDT